MRDGRSWRVLVSGFGFAAVLLIPDCVSLRLSYFATIAFDRGTELSWVKDWPGHENISATMLCDHRDAGPEGSLFLSGGVLVVLRLLGSGFWWLC